MSQMCGIVLSTNSVISLYDHSSTSFTRANIVEFLPVIRYPPILDYYTGLYYINQAKSEKKVGSKLIFMKTASLRLENALGFQFPNAMGFYVESLFEAMKLDRNLVGIYLCTDDIIEKYGKYFAKQKFQKSTQEYLDYLCSCLWKLFSTPLSPVKDTCLKRRIN